VAGFYLNRPSLSSSLFPVMRRLVDARHLTHELQTCGVRTLANTSGAIELYVEDCRDAGDPVPTEVGKEFVEVEAA
jgi:hypothetical protein